MAAAIRVTTMLSGIAIGDPLGGAERFGVDLARRLDRSRFAPRICALWRFDNPAEREWLEILRAEGIPVLFATPAAVRHPLSFARAVSSLARQNAGEKTDIVHSHLPLSSLAAVLLKRRFGAQALVRTSHLSHEWGDGPTSFAARQIFTNWVYPLVFEQEACVSAQMKTRWDHRPGARLAKKETLLTYNAIDIDRYRPRDDGSAARAALDLPADALVVGCVSRLAPVKGIDDLLDAAVLVRAQMPGVRFVHIGGGPQWEQLHARRDALGLRDAFSFCGQRNDAHLLYPALDLFVLPSLVEGLPSVVIESMASGVPVIASDIPGTRELVADGETGWLVPPENPQTLAATILAALRDPAERARRAARAREEVLPRFNFDDTVQQYEAVYERVLGLHAAAAGSSGV